MGRGKRGQTALSAPGGAGKIDIVGWGQSSLSPFSVSRMLRRLAMVVAVAGLAPLASAYYYWIYFASGNAPFTPVPVRFDLNPADPYGLQNNMAPYVISEAGPSALMPGDSFQAIVSEIRAAANVWNTVNTSAVKLEFGGLSPMTTPEASAGVDVVFSDDIPPGLLAQTFVTTVANPQAYLASGATFLPLVHSQIQLQSDLTLNQQSSYSDAFFVTIVHEFGHSLGLQHTETSSVMSTQITSASTKASPLAADDIAGLSLLYPANGYPAGTGSISGTVTLGGAGVNMASVVALSVTGTAISAITNPDGTFTINGVPVGQYYVYASPLPPAAEGEAYPDNLFPPIGPNGNAFQANTSFGTEFLGETTDWTQAQQVTVTAGVTAPGANIGVPPRPNGPAVSAMTTYGFPGAGNVAVGASPPIQSYGWLVFKANGVVVNGNAVAPGLTLSVIGGAAYFYNPYTGATGNIAPLYYTGQFLEIGLAPNQVNAPTPAAVTATLNGDVYVLPSAFRVVQSAPPSIAAVNGTTDPSGNATVTITGSNLAGSQIVFDSIAAVSTTANPDGSVTAVAPPATSGYQASVEALGSDSQTSWETLAAGTIPPRFTYGGPAFPAIGVSLPGGATSIAAGTDSMVEITGYNTDFVTGETVAGFASSDVVVTGVWVVNPGLAYANVAVNPNAAAQAATVTAESGLGLETASAALQIAPAAAGQATLLTPILNQATGLDGVPAGGIAVINASGLPENLSGWTLTIADQVTTYTVAANNQLLAQVPAGAQAGPVLVRLFTPAGTSLPPVVMQIDVPPPVITAASNSSGVAIGQNSPVTGGATVSLTIYGLADQSGNLPALSAIDINIGGVNVTALAVTPAGQNVSVLQFAIPAGLGSGPQNVTIQVGTRVSAAFTIVLQ